MESLGETEGAIHIALEVVEFVDVQPALDVVHDLQKSTRVLS